ncbi:ribonuclease P protein component [Curtobacterium sp. Leaf261]|uniref:ribonuclease P protein component n=1 Tax=Curtobacterium sp. Leaf261 TaxID=1736311 RepID=UPI0009E68AEA|nr:ribonuclease P protein component [Curtobacterium sp. Leaf261]
MLPKTNRIVRGDDYRTAVRRGRRSATAHVVVSVVHRTTSDPTRFGFIVSKAVGNAVTRNLLRRRFKGIAHDIVLEHPTGYDVAIRALPAAAQADWLTLVADVNRSFDRSVAAAGPARGVAAAVSDRSVRPIDGVREA